MKVTNAIAAFTLLIMAVAGLAAVSEFKVSDTRIASMEWQHLTIDIYGEESNKETFFLTPIFRVLKTPNGALSRLWGGNKITIRFLVKDPLVKEEAVRVLNLRFATSPQTRQKYFSGTGLVTVNHFLDLPLSHARLGLTNLGSITPRPYQVGGPGQVTILGEAYHSATWEFATDAAARNAYTMIESGNVGLMVEIGIQGVNWSKVKVNVSMEDFKSLDLTNNVASASKGIDDPRQYFTISQIGNIVSNTLRKTTVEISNQTVDKRFS